MQKSSFRSSESCNSCPLPLRQTKERRAGEEDKARAKIRVCGEHFHDCTQLRNSQQETECLASSGLKVAEASTVLDILNTGRIFELKQDRHNIKSYLFEGGYLFGCRPSDRGGPWFRYWLLDGLNGLNSLPTCFRQMLLDNFLLCFGACFGSHNNARLFDWDGRILGSLGEQFVEGVV